MRTLIICFLFDIIALSANAQKAPIRFGDVSKEELSMTTYDKDSTASAVILADYGISTISYSQNSGFSLDFERITRIKILTKEGLSWGDFSISLYRDGSDDEKLTGLKAVTYNLEDGKIVESKVKNDQIFEENVDAHWEITKVTCPNVREGSIVEIAYKVNSPFWFNFQDWTFQSRIPTVISEYRAKVPEYFIYDRYMQGYVSLDVTDETRTPNSIRFTSFERQGTRVTQSTAVSDQIDYMDINNRWVANHVPAFKPEPYMTSVSNFITKINFELAAVKFPNQPVKNFMGSWADINNTLQESENFGSEITGNGFLKKAAEELTAGMSTAEEKITAVCSYVKQNVLWNGSQQMYPASALRKVLDDKKGSSAEINFLVGSMLEKVGIEVVPVVLSTRDHGFVRPAMPISSQFNYVIFLAKANDKTFLLDATEKLLPVGMLPERCLNGQGFGVSKDGFQWIPLESKFKTRMVTSGDFVVSDDGQLEGKLKLDCNGYAALENRKKYLGEGEAEFLKDFVGSHEWEVRSTSVQNANEIYENFTQEHELVVNENLMLAGEMMYLDPFICERYKENPFKAEVREYPVDFGSPIEETLFFKITIPENYDVDELPASKVLAMPENGARYIYNVVRSGNIVTVTSMFNINKSLFTQVEYPYLREFYNQIVAKQSEQIVLKRKEL